MADHRRPPIPYSDAERGTCRWCGAAILHESGEKRGAVNRRRRWHPACVEAYEESDPREARRRVRQRDRGRCAACGLDTLGLRRQIGRGRGSTRRLRALGFRPRTSLWELDHIVPLVDGGGHDLANLQTLCMPCHKRKTAHEAERRGAARRAARHRAAEDDLLARADAALLRSNELVIGLGADPLGEFCPSSSSTPGSARRTGTMGPDVERGATDRPDR